MNESPRFSLLFADPDAPKEFLYGEDVLNFIAPVAEESEELKTILRLKTNRKDIAFRKEILEDFLQYPSLLTKIEKILRRRETLSETARREQDVPPDLSWRDALEILKENSLSLMEHLRFLRSSYEETADQAPDSVGLFAFCEYLRRHALSPEVQSLAEQVGTYPLLRADEAKAVLHLNLNRYGMKTSAHVAYLGTDDSKYLKKHPLRKEDFSAVLPKERTPELTAEALRNLSSEFRRLTAGIRAAFEPLREGMVFYRYALKTAEWARSNKFPLHFASPVAEHGPAGKGIRDLQETEDGILRPTLSLTARSLEIYEGDWGTETLKNIARIQIFSAAGLPVPSEDLVFCPEERIVVYDPKEKTVEREIEALADLYRNTRKGDVILMNQPLITVGNSPAEEIVTNLLRAFHKKGAAVRLATDLSVR